MCPLRLGNGGASRDGRGPVAAAASPRPPSDGRERRELRAAAGWALRKVPGWGTCHRLPPRRGAQRGPAAGGCSAAGPAPQPRRQRAAAGGGVSRSASAPAPSSPAPRARRPAQRRDWHGWGGAAPPWGAADRGDAGRGARSPPALRAALPPAEQPRPAGPAPAGGAMLRCLPTSCGLADRDRFSSAGTQPHGWLSWGADSTPRRLFNGLLLVGVPPEADPTELESTGNCQTPSADTFWSDLLC